jgi:type IV pilus assembly protein PilW
MNYLSDRNLTMKKTIMKNTQFLNRQSGLSLLELLVAMTLGVIVLGAAVSMQVTFRQGFDSTDNKLNMQTNARFAFNFISSSLFEMGSMGCLTGKGYLRTVATTEEKRKKYLTNNNLYKAGANTATGTNTGNSAFIISFADPSLDIADFRYQQELDGYDDSGAPVAPVLLVPASNAGSDVLIVKGGYGPTYVFDNSSLYASNHTQLTIDPLRYPVIDLKTNEYAVLSQCDGAEVFQMTSVNTTTGVIKHETGGPAPNNEKSVFATHPDKTLGSLTFKQGQIAELRRVASVAYYVSNDAAGDPVLFRSVDGVANPLVEGVEQMQVLYGMDLDGDKVPDTFRNANAARAASANNNLAEAVSLRLSFVMRSKDAVYDAAFVQTHSMPGETDFKPNDTFARQVFTTTVTLRNRLTGNRTGANL